MSEDAIAAVTGPGSDGPEAARLACSGLTGGHGALTAFRDVDLAVGPGRVLSLLGPNGAGKTSLLLTLAGLLVPHGGKIHVDGTSLPGGRPAAANRAGIVLVPDGRCLFTTLTVEENLQAAARRGGPAPRDLLDVFPALEPRWRVLAGSLSGGEQQMLAMARALVQEPKAMLVDEMSMGLAPLVTEALFDTIRRIAGERGCSVVIVEQHVALALEVADEALVISRGEIALRGPAADLASDPDRLEQAYLGAVDGSVC